MHHDHLEYRSHAGVATISVDYGSDTEESNVYASQTTNWEAQNGKEAIPVPLQEKMTADLKNGLALLKGKFVVL